MEGKVPGKVMRIWVGVSIICHISEKLGLFFKRKSFVGQLFKQKYSMIDNSLQISMANGADNNKI